MQTSGQSFPMPIGGTRAILSMETGEYRSGHSREHGWTELASKFMVVICSLFATVRFS